MLCPKCGKKLQKTYKCSDCQLNLKQMSWYRFLIYFLLFAEALLAVVSGIRLLVGDAPDGLYINYPMMLEIDRVFGILYLFLGAGYLLCRQSLYRFKKRAVSLYLVLVSCSATIGLIYKLTVHCFYRLKPTSFVFDSLVLIFYAVLFVLSAIYFKKRNYLFMNG